MSIGGHRLVVVSGATRGIGRAVVDACLARGVDVVGLARDTAALATLERATDGRVRGVAIDLAHAEGRAGALARIEAAAGAMPSAFVHAAGIASYLAALAVDGDELRTQYEVHAVAPFELTRALARRWIDAATPGAVVTVSSTLAHRPAPYTVAYAMAKAAQEAMVRGLALELAPHGIRVNAVAPGVIDTDMVRAERPDGEATPEARLATLAALHPLGRLGRPEEVAGAVMHLLEASFTTGTTSIVDGGLSIR